MLKPIISGITALFGVNLSIALLFAVIWFAAGVATLPSILLMILVPG